MSDGNDSDSDDRNTIGAAGVLAGSAQHEYGGQDPYRLDGVRGSYDGERHATLAQDQPVLQSADRALAAPVVAQSANVPQQQAYQEPVYQQQQPAVAQQPIAQQQPAVSQQPMAQQQPTIAQQGQSAPTSAFDNMRHNSSYGDWMGPAAGGAVAGAGAGVLGTEAYRRHQRDATVPETEGDVSPVSPTEATDPVADAAVVPAEIPSEAATSSAAYAAVPVNPTASEELAEPAETRRGSPGIIGLSDAATPVTSLPSKPSFGDRSNIDGILSGTSTPPTTAAAISAPLSAPSAGTAARSEDEGLGGNERVGAHETGELFPRVIRHDTSLSVSALHVPGEFPSR